MLLQAPCQPCGPVRGISGSGCSRGKATMRTMMVPGPAEGMPAGNRPGQMPGTGLYRVAPRGVLGQASRKCSCCSWACFYDPKEIPHGTMNRQGVMASTEAVWPCKAELVAGRDGCCCRDAGLVWRARLVRPSSGMQVLLPAGAAGRVKVCRGAGRW
ncbi:hypothetical protein LHGZ1_2037 [Laribacter hongkongensis]|uniref:Uncharacterized protein n=1 Tax=Laribacter hongkongensis TaxID=168471 RepID=A0A248LJE6_9NEIS|nr:hypothetical protein LHGZ1_2037 [Laribacter hongkongensis]